MRGTRFTGLIGLAGLALVLPGIASARAPVAVRVVQTTANLAQHLTPLPDRQFGGSRPRGPLVVRVNDGRRFQRIGGFGAAMTDTSAWLLEQKADPQSQQSTIEALFGQSGIRLGFVRVPIGASDFTAARQPYSYDDMPGGQTDVQLSSFTIGHDEAYILPALRQAEALHPGLRILATPWSPPAWMKTNGSLDNLRHRGRLLASAAGSWGQYFVKFLQAYAAAGVNVTAISPQNEPTIATPYPGFELPAWQERKLVGQTLLPALRAAGLRPAIYGSELGWGPGGGSYARTLLSHGGAHTFDGIAWHCYFGTPEVMPAIRSLAPGLDYILSECAPGLVQFPTSEIVIASLRSWASTVALWNLALDPDGGPVQPPNAGCPRCTALVTVEEDTGKVRLTQNYFQLGQVSAFVEAGARRIDTPHFVRYRYRPAANIASSGLDDVAFLDPDGTRVLVAYANSSRPIHFAVSWRGRSFGYTLPARAMVTFSWRPS